MSSVPTPHRGIDLINSANAGLLDDSNAIRDRQRQEALAQKHEADQNAELHPEFQKYIDRVLAGEDPVQVANEARSRPDFQDIVHNTKGPATEQPRGYRDSMLGGPGAPNMQAGPPQGAPPPQAAPPQAPPQPQRSVGDPNWRPPAGFHPSQAPSLGAADVQMRPGTDPVRGVQGLDAYTMMGRPMQGPAIDPQSVGAMGQQGGMPPPQPVQQALPPPVARQAPPPQAPAHQPWRVKDMAQLQSILPTAIAARGRQAAAQTGATAKTDVATIKATADTVRAIMREQGKSEAEIDTVMTAIMNEKGRNARAGDKNASNEAIADEKAGAARDVASINANGRVSAAGAKGSGGSGGDKTEAELGKDLRATEKNINDLMRTPDYKKDSDAGKQVQALEERRKALAEKLGRPYAPTKPPAAAAPAASKPAEPEAKYKYTKDGKFRYKVLAGGKLGPKEEYSK